MSTLHELAVAMRKGAALRPQCYDAYFQYINVDGEWLPIASCALGAAYEGKGRNASAEVGLDVMRKAFPEACGVNCRCPVCHDASTVLPMVTHLNDHHRWTRQAIADWLDTL